MITPFTRFLGILLLILGIIGFLQQPALWLFQIDTSHAVLLVLAGILGIVAARFGKPAARMYLIATGIFWALAAIIGFVNHGDILGLLTTNRADSYLHAVIALASLGIGFRD